MIGHCACVASGLSSHAIARAFGHCQSGGFDYPHDPSDLNRCVRYCQTTGISTEALVDRMTPVSPQWAALLTEWDSLVTSLKDEAARGDTAPNTYAQMRRLIEGVRS